MTFRTILSETRQLVHDFVAVVAITSMIEGMVLADRLPATELLAQVRHLLSGLVT